VLIESGTAPEAAAPLLQLDGFEGPLDLLLELARAQKVDLSRISILRLVEQYLAVVEAERRVRLELAADWLVMAAWLAWLKSRLLLPREEDEAEQGEAAAELLAARLAELAHVGRAAAWLGARDQLGHDVFARGAPEDLVEIDRSGLTLDLPQLLGAYMAAMRRTAKRRVYRPKPLVFWTVQDALARLRTLLGDDMPDWCALELFLPDFMDLRGTAATHPNAHRAALAGTLIAGLELARSGVVELLQEEQFGAILLRRSDRAPMQEAAE
jgi:segregation and condensation protein A